MENLELIDWAMVGLAALWIAGLAVILSALGFADYHAAAGGRKFRQEVGRPLYRAAINFGLMLFSMGLIGSSRAWWDAALWGVLAAAFAGYAIHALRRPASRGERLTDLDPRRGARAADPPAPFRGQAGIDRDAPTSPGAESSTGQPSVLVICSANRCRSPMAAALLQQLLEREGLLDRYRVDTAGTWADEGVGAAPVAQAVMRERGLDLGQHRSRRVSGDLLRAFDLVLVMEAGQREALVAEFPDVGPRLHLLAAMAGEPYSLRDPVEGTLEAYRSLADELADLLRRGLPRIRRLLE